jgi:hypothetical protein
VLSSIGTHGLQPAAHRLDAFANAQRPALPTETREQRQAVVDRFRPNMTSGERGNTLNAWVRDPAQPIATAISVHTTSGATDTVPYAHMGEGSAFPAVLGIRGGLPTERRPGIDHSMLSGRVSPSAIPAVYVPPGRSRAANTALHGTPMSGRARSFSDLFSSK